MMNEKILKRKYQRKPLVLKRYFSTKEVSQELGLPLLHTRVLGEIFCKVKRDKRSYYFDRKQIEKLYAILKKRVKVEEPTQFEEERLLDLQG
jgi:hypothetical protein